MRFLFVFAAVFAVAFAQYGGPNEPDPVPTTDYPLEPEVNEPVDEVPVKEVVVEEPVKEEPVVVVPVSSSEAPVVLPSSAEPLVSVVPEFPVAPSSTLAPPVLRSKYPSAQPVFVPTFAPSPKAFTRRPSPVPVALQNVPVAPVPTAFVKTIASASSSDRMAKTTQEVNEINPNGEYVYGFQSDNGISQQAQGNLRNFDGNPPSQAIVVNGSFSWTANNGEPIVFRYTADENGYHPESDALPTPPPVPPQIARAVEFLRKIYQERELKSQK